MSSMKDRKRYLSTVRMRFVYITGLFRLLRLFSTVRKRKKEEISLDCTVLRIIRKRNKVIEYAKMFVSRVRISLDCKEEVLKFVCVRPVNLKIP